VGVAGISSTGVDFGDKTLSVVETAAEMHGRATKRREAGVNGGIASGTARNGFAVHAAISALRRNALAKGRPDT
jgi:hypothetical protein